MRVKKRKEQKDVARENKKIKVKKKAATENTRKKMADKGIREEENIQNPFLPIVSFLQNLHFELPPQFKRKKEVKKVESESKVVDFVKVGDGRNKKEFPGLKLEGDEGQQGGGNMWQVYALGGFLVGRWLWARWNERKAAKSDKEEPSGDPEPPSL
ncbi:hypothetical protein IFM89_006085 [Coptis chinensis]|uniref:Uncharacterized protein n=1 Tax=Coptis chinensis TaxID=261450 RepID=A0A835H3Y0_9MAGN|nr:hypothetical protein IFM89_006085 [Coptis chinensis]